MLSQGVRPSTFVVAGKFTCSARIHRSDQAKRVAIMLPALGVPVDKYLPFIDRLRAAGMHVLMADMPGCVGNQPLPSRKNDYGYGDLVRDYIPALVELARQEIPHAAPVLIGHGLGGHIAALYAMSDGVPCSVVGIGAGNIWFNHWPGMQKLLTLRASLMFYGYTALYGYLPGKRIGFGYHEASRLMRDWSRVALTGRYDHISFTRRSPPERQSKAVFIAINQDEWAPIKSVRALASHIPGSRVVQVETPLPTKGNRHSAWIRDPASIANAIIKEVRGRTI